VQARGVAHRASLGPLQDDGQNAVAPGAFGGVAEVRHLVSGAK
jgi:hypothetical protein